MADVYVDDEIQLAQGSAARLNRIRRVLRMHCNDLVFRPNNSEDDPDIRKEPMSMKKFSKGDGCWATSKTILGWTIDTLQRTIELPPHRQERLMTILEEVRGRKRVSVKSCHKLLGELRSMVMGIPGGRGLFSQLQLALTASKGSRVCLHQGARDHIEDLWMLAKDIVRRPTRSRFPPLPAADWQGTPAAEWQGTPKARRFTPPAAASLHCLQPNGKARAPRSRGTGAASGRRMPPRVGNPEEDSVGRG